MRDAGRNTFLICGCILTFVGAVFSGVGIWMFNNMAFVRANGTGDVEAMPFIFAGLGATLLVTGVVVLLCLKAKSAVRKKLMENGQYVIAEITGVTPDYSVRRGRFPTYRVECRYLDRTTETEHVFYSKNLPRDPSDALKSNTVHVYVNKEDHSYRDYYVDIDEVLPEIRVH